MCDSLMLMMSVLIVCFVVLIIGVFMCRIGSFFVVCEFVL